MNSRAKGAKARVLGVAIDAVNMAQATARISDLLERREKGYICLAGVHGVMEVQRSGKLAGVFSQAALVAPDGMPTVWVGRLQGHSAMEQVTGPDLMLEVMRQGVSSQTTHYLCGGQPGVAEELRERLGELIPDVKIVGTFMPPFEGMSRESERSLVKHVREVKPDIVWVGMSTPKQEAFMAHYLPKLQTCLMFGVGAAFDFHTGRIKDCPRWVKQAGFQWFDRLLQDPRHLWRRYLRNNPAFLLHMCMQLTHLRGERKYVSTMARQLTVTGEPGSK